MNEREKFVGLLDPYGGTWDLIDIRSVCFMALGRWINLGTRLILSVTRPDEIEVGRLPTFPGFGAFHEVRGISALPELLSELDRGVIRVGGQEVSFAKIENNEVRLLPPNYFLQTVRRPGPCRPPDFHLPYILLQRSGEAIHNLLHSHPEVPERETLDWKLRSLPTPYDGLNDVFGSFLGLPSPPWGAVTESTVVHVVAPIPFRFLGDCELLKGRLTIAVEAIELARDDNLSIGVVEFSGGRILRRSSYDLSKDGRTVQDRRFVSRTQLTVRDASSVTIFLRVRGMTIDTLSLADSSVLPQNPRITAYSHFDREMATLRTYLQGRGADRSGDLEVGVALVLHLCGFNVGLYGRLKGVQEEVDLIAFDPSSKNVIAAECTIADLDVKEKLSKLSRRVRELARALPGFDLMPMIVTALPSASIATSDRQKAMTERIAVIAAEEINELLEMAGRQVRPEDIATHLASLIPSESPDK